MECAFCTRLLDTNYYVKVCSKCLSDDDIMISGEDIPDRFLLSWYELRTANLFCICHFSGQKYLLSDVLELSRKLTEELTDRSAKKKVYLKQREVMDNIIKKREELINYKNNIKQLVVDIISKYNIELNDKINYQMRKLIDADTETINLPEFAIAVKICDELIPFDKMLKRNKLIDSLISKTFGENYIGKVNKIKEYCDYIKDESITIDNAFEGCKNVIEGEINYNKRKNEMDNLITTTFCKKYFRSAALHRNYSLYVDKAEGTLEENFSRINTTINNLKIKDARKRKIDKLINKTIPSNKLNLATNNTAYKNYIGKGGNIDNVMNNILDFTQNNI